MEKQENKIAHLQLISQAIARMGSNSFLLRGWSVTLLVATFALADKNLAWGYFAAFIPVLGVFWGLDAYYLCIENKFQELHKQVAARRDDEITFLMDIHQFRNLSYQKGTLHAFYAALAVIAAVLIIVKANTSSQQNVSATSGFVTTTTTYPVGAVPVVTAPGLAPLVTVYNSAPSPSGSGAAPVLSGSGTAPLPTKFSAAPAPAVAPASSGSAVLVPTASTIGSGSAAGVVPSGSIAAPGLSGSAAKSKP